MYAPMGDGGVYEYVEPWYSFAVKKESDAQDYAVEFLRFMARQDELNTLASIKGVPSAAKETTDERYTALNDIDKVGDEGRQRWNGSGLHRHAPEPCGKRTAGRQHRKRR